MYLILYCKRMDNIIYKNKVISVAYNSFDVIPLEFGEEEEFHFSTKKRSFKTPHCLIHL